MTIIRNENFDCTQIISFAFSDEDDVDRTFYGLDDFIKLGFTIVFDKNIRRVKKDYFHKKDNEIFIEFENKKFIGEFDDWLIQREAPKLIDDYCSAVINFIEKNNLTDVRIFISSFSENGKSSDIEVSSTISDLKEKLFLMSKNNFDEWGDNIIINIMK